MYAVLSRPFCWSRLKQLATEGNTTHAGRDNPNISEKKKFVSICKQLIKKILKDFRYFY
jgi:hypothetical protein